jgi:hypothetical protein
MAKFVLTAASTYRSTGSGKVKNNADVQQLIEVSRRWQRLAT